MKAFRFIPLMSWFLLAPAFADVTVTSPAAGTTVTSPCNMSPLARRRPAPWGLDPWAFM